MTLTPGTRLGQCVVRSLLGAGGMGEVYRAQDTRLGRDVAIKVLPAALTADSERLRRFEQEARAAAALSHPNILSVYQMATEDGVTYLISELLEGQTLRERLLQGALPPRKTVEYGAQIANGLAAAHERGIVHRDLKPENLFVTRDGRVKILDFGLARLVQADERLNQDPNLEPTRAQATEVGTVLGTAGYMAPEQVRGRPADHRADIFALGTILYEMTTGRQSFRKPTSAETMAAILNEEPAAISQLAPAAPPGLQRVIHRCLEKNPEQRFQSASDLAFALESLSDSAITPPTAAAAPDRRRRARLGMAAVAGALLLLVVAGLVYLWLRPPVVPKVTSYEQLTHDGMQKSLGGTDGSRLYLLFYGAGYSPSSMAEMSVSGGEVKTFASLPPSMYPSSISPDGSKLLLVQGEGMPLRGPLWSMPLLGGSMRRLGATEGENGAWSPDGRMLAYGNGKDLFLSKADGTEPKKLASLNDPAFVTDPVWSPDGSVLRFSDSNLDTQTRELWEISPDGTNLHRLLPGWHDPPDECCGRWTADGKYFVFQAASQIWALPEFRGWFRAAAKPIRLTSSPMSLYSPLPSKDGKKLFVVGATTRGELMRYDTRSRRFEPYLSGISAEYLDFSRDGQWVTYVSYPQGALWRSKVDGSERLQLTYPPGYALLPRWSPDRSKIIFYQLLPKQPATLYEVSAAGGSPRQLLAEDPQPKQDPNWSPDGTRIVIGGNANDSHSTIRIMNLDNSQLETVPRSAGMFSPRWSPDGRSLVALSVDQRRLLHFDFRSGQWTELTRGTLGWLNYSHDGRYVYLVEASGDGKVIRVRLSDHKVEPVLDLKAFVATGFYGGWLALTPDDSPLLLREAGTSDVYALDWEAP